MSVAVTEARSPKNRLEFTRFVKKVVRPGIAAQPRGQRSAYEGELVPGAWKRQAKYATD